LVGIYKYPEYDKEYREKNKEKIREYHKKYYNKNKEKLSSLYREKKYSEQYRNTRLQYYYGISLEEYNFMLKEQGGVCAICKRNQINGKGSFLHVDHSKETGKVRGLLCNHCNIAIGLLLDDPVCIRRAADYIEKCKTQI